VVVSGQDLTTAAITNVPVSLATGVTALNTPQTAILPAASAMASVAGVITNMANDLLTEAVVSASQTLSTGQVLAVASAGVDVFNADFSMRLPLAAAVKATYVPGAALSFSTDGMVAGRYNLSGNATGYTTQSTDSVLDLGLADTITLKNLVLTP